MAPFRGPAARIALIEDEQVRRRRWMSHEYFLDLLGAANIIPGPDPAEPAIHFGVVPDGRKGLLIAEDRSAGREPGGPPSFTRVCARTTKKKARE